MKKVLKNKQPIKLVTVLIVIALSVISFLNNKGGANTKPEVNISETTFHSEKEKTENATETNKTENATAINKTENTNETVPENENNNTVISPASLVVDVSGEVNSPGVYTLSEGARVNDAIIAAGGLTEKGDISYINRAAPIADGTKIYIPSVVKTDGDSNTILKNQGQINLNNNGGYIHYNSPEYGDSIGGKVNINTADKTALETIPGIGPVTAEKILVYREKNGKFNALDEIMNVSGIGEKTFERIEEYITL